MKTLELFSGAGGLALGLQRAGYEIVAAVELNRDAAATYQIHHPNTHVINDDVSAIDFSAFARKVDCVVGGPPCQPFSLGGLRKGRNDRRDMLPQFVRCLETIRPSCFIMENVPGLTLKSARPYFAELVATFRRLAYHVSYSVLNAAEFGVAQKRKRLFVIGSLSRELRFPASTHGDELRPIVRARDVINFDAPIGEPPNCPVRYAKFPDLRPSPYAGHVYNGGGRPLDPDGPSHTILASSGGYKTHWVDTCGVAPEYHAHLISGGTPREGVVPGARRLTVEECALLQSFPAHMEFVGRRSSQYKQVGDAVPPVLSHALGSAVLAQMSGSVHSSNLKLLPALSELPQGCLAL